MTKLIKVEGAKPDFVMVRIDQKFMDDLPKKFSHIECPNCTCTDFKIATFDASIGVGCKRCAWQFFIPYEVMGPANVYLPV